MGEPEHLKGLFGNTYLVDFHHNEKSPLLNESQCGHKDPWLQNSNHGLT